MFGKDEVGRMKDERNQGIGKSKIGAISSLSHFRGEASLRARVRGYSDYQLPLEAYMDSRTCYNSPNLGNLRLFLLWQGWQMSPERKNLNKQLDFHRRNLAILEAQAAAFGSLYTPAHLNIQIEDTRKKIAETEALGNIGDDRALPPLELLRMDNTKPFGDTRTVGQAAAEAIRKIKEKNGLA